MRAQTTRWHTVDSSRPFTLPLHLSGWRSLTAALCDPLTWSYFQKSDRRKRLRQESSIWWENVTNRQNKGECVLQKAISLFHLWFSNQPVSHLRLKPCSWGRVTLFGWGTVGKVPAETSICKCGFGSKSHQCYFPPTQTQHNQLRGGCIAVACKVAPSVWTFPHKFTLVRSQSVPSDLNLTLSLPRLHFTLSVLSLCLITRRSMLTVNLLGGERDWEIKYILNSFPLMWQLLPPSLSLTSSLLSRQHSADSVPRHISFMFCTQKSVSFTPSRISNFTAEMFCHSLDLRWIRCTCVAGKSVCCRVWVLQCEEKEKSSNPNLCRLSLMNVR